jgi:hypothetical protein
MRCVRLCRGFLQLGRLPALKELNLICHDFDEDTEAALKAMLPGLKLGGCSMP